LLLAVGLPISFGLANSHTGATTQVASLAKPSQKDLALAASAVAPALRVTVRTPARVAHAASIAVLAAGKVGSTLPVAVAAQQAVQAARQFEAAPKPAAAPAKPKVAAAPAPRPVTRAPRALASFVLRATGYNSLRGQTDGSPFVTATGARTRFGIVALSRDMLRRIPYGSLVRLEDLSGRFNYMLRGMSFVVEDTMHPRKYGQVDVWFPAYGQAISWGVRQVRLTVVRYGRG
jgi:3D (Asp-Asp-Asp) domain-containing protein